MTFNTPPVPEQNQSIEPDQLRAWLLPRLAQPNIVARLAQFRALYEALVETNANWLTEADLSQIWIELNNGVSELPSSSTNLASANKPSILRSAASIARKLSDSPGTRLVMLHRFFKINGEFTAQLPHYVRAVALFDPAHAPTVTAYRALPAALQTLGFAGDTTPWERLIQDGRIAELDAAIGFAFTYIMQVLPDCDMFERAIALEFVPGYVKGFQRLTVPRPTPPPRPVPAYSPRNSRDYRPPRRTPADHGERNDRGNGGNSSGDRPLRRSRSGPSHRD